jgi:hypothetical protein
MRITKKAKPDLDCDRSCTPRRKELLSLAGSLSAEDAKALRSRYQDHVEELALIFSVTVSL